MSSTNLPNITSEVSAFIKHGAYVLHYVTAPLTVVQCNNVFSIDKEIKPQILEDGSIELTADTIFDSGLLDADKTTFKVKFTF